MDQENQHSTCGDMNVSTSNSQEFYQKDQQGEMDISCEEANKQLSPQPKPTHQLLRSLLQAETDSSSPAQEDTDTFNVQLPMQELIYFPEYSQQILQAWLHLETMPCYSLPSDFLSRTAIPQAVLQQMRITLMDWLVSLQLYLQLSNEALQLTVNITDRFTAVSPTSLQKSNYQLIGLAALSIASKFEEIAIPDFRTLCSLSDNAYTRHQLAAMEKQVYFSLDCCVSNPQPIHFLRYFSILLSRDSLEHSLAKYFLELSLLLQPDAAHIRASLRAAVCLSLASRLLVNSSHVMHSMSHLLEMEQQQLQGSVDSLVSQVRRITCEKGAGLFVYQKYSDKKFHRVSTLQCLSNL